MNDSELITAVKESVTGVHMSRRSRSSAVAARYAPGAGFPAWQERWPWWPGWLWPWLRCFRPATSPAVSPPPSWRPGRSSSRLTARSLSQSASCVIRPGGRGSSAPMASRPASPSSASLPPARVRGYPADTALINRVFTVRHAGRFPVMIIHPSALPGGVGVQINPPVQQHIIRVAIGLVHASPQCTGS